jgi:predicted MFS family arabinose efflux permease
MLSLVMGTIASFDVPVRQSFVVHMVEDRADLPNAIALNSMLINGPRIVGPALAGVLIGSVGAGVCFLLNAISYLAVIVALLRMKVRPHEPRPESLNVFARFRDGYRYAFGSPVIRPVLVLLGVVSLLGMSFGTLVSMFADPRNGLLGGGSPVYGLMLSAGGVGAVLGGLVLARRRGSGGLEKLIARAPLILGLSIIGFSFSRELWLSLLLLATAGFGVMTQVVSSNTLLQTLVPDDKRGRVMSFYSMAFLGVSPFGALLMSGLARLLGSAPHAMLVGGICCVVAGVVFHVHLPRMNQEEQRRNR